MDAFVGDSDHLYVVNKNWSDSLCTARIDRRLRMDLASQFLFFFTLASLLTICFECHDDGFLRVVVHCSPDHPSVEPKSA